MSKKLKKWEDFEQELNITPEQEAEILRQEKKVIFHKEN